MTSGSVPWRDTKLTLIWLRADAPITAAYTIADKRAMLASLEGDDQLLAVRQVQYPQHQEVMVVDDLDVARQALAE